MELTERKLKILQAIIEDYVRSAEPVGSRTLSKRFDLGISPATIRNEMSDLEEMGLSDPPAHLSRKSTVRKGIQAVCQQSDGKTGA